MGALDQYLTGPYANLASQQSTFQNQLNQNQLQQFGALSQWLQNQQPYYQTIYNQGMQAGLPTIQAQYNQGLQNNAYSMGANGLLFGSQDWQNQGNIANTAQQSAGTLSAQSQSAADAQRQMDLSLAQNYQLLASQAQPGQQATVSDILSAIQGGSQGDTAYYQALLSAVQNQLGIAGAQSQVLGQQMGTAANAIQATGQPGGIFANQASTGQTANAGVAAGTKA